MTPAGFRFEHFVLEPDDRRLRRGDATVELNARYLDALALLVREQGRLVSKDRFLEEVWRGVPVTDEALTQCIKTLRRQLGDDASKPTFIETVPKHGYRFIAPVEAVAGEPGAGAAARASDGRRRDWRQALLLGISGTLGGGAAGLIGGLFYGLAGASQPLAPGMGAVSVLLVLVSLITMVALVGGAGVAFGISASAYAFGRRSAWTIAGGAVGGLAVGALVKLLGIDAFTLLLGRSPGDVTGAAAGALLGSAVGFGAWLAGRGMLARSRGRATAAAALAGGAAGILISLLGGRLMGGSLDLLARQFPGSRLRLDPIGALFGESGFGPFSQVATSSLEGMLFAGCVVGAMIIARRRWSTPS